MVKKIILVFKTHFDIGFTDLAENVIHSYGNDMLREVIETCKATEGLGKLRYVWTMPAWPLWYICNNCDPELKPELDRLIENGQIVWHMLPFTSHTDFSAPEEYAQTLRYSMELSRRYGKPLPVAAKMTDVPGHGLMLPDLLDQAGIRFLHLGCNEFATPPQVPGLFFWQGPGGGKVLTMYSKGGYGTGLLPPKDWPYPVWMAMMHTHDNCGPQSAELILKMAKKAQAACPEAEIVCGTMDDFYRELAKSDLSDIPVIRNDLADTWIHGVGSYPGEVSLMRSCRERSRRFHALYLEKLLSGGSSPEIEELWKEYYDAVALFTEHTWGADVKTWLGPDRVYEKEEFQEARSTERYRFMERSWDEQRRRAGQAKTSLDKLEKLLGWSGPEALADAGQALTVERQGDLVTVSNHRYRLTLDGRTGRINALHDMLLDTPLLEAGEEGIFAYRYDRYGLEDITEFLRGYGYHFTTWGIQDYGRENYPDCAREIFYPQFEGWEVSGRELRLCYLPGQSCSDYGDCEKLTLTIRFPEEGDRLELTLKLDNKQATPFVESGSLVLPFAGAASYRIGKPGGAIDPENQIQDCANHALFNLEREVTVLGRKGALSICSLDAPLFGIGSPGVYEYHKQFGSGRKPVLYFNLFNNMWGTNFPQWTEGSFSYRFVLRGCTLREAENAAAWAAEVCRGNSGISADGMELVHVQALDGLIYVTLRDLTGREGTGQFRARGMALRQVDFTHRSLGEWRENEIAFPVRPNGLHVFEMRRLAP